MTLFWDDYRIMEIERQAQSRFNDYLDLRADVRKLESAPKPKEHGDVCPICGAGESYVSKRVEDNKNNRSYLMTWYLGYLPGPPQRTTEHVIHYQCGSRLDKLNHKFYAKCIVVENDEPKKKAKK